MIQAIIQLVQKFAASIIQLLPQSPFRDFIEEFQTPEYLGWLNWIFPVGACLRVLAAWLVSIGLFYFYSIAARWIKIIGD